MRYYYIIDCVWEVHWNFCGRDNKSDTMAIIFFNIESIKRLGLYIISPITAKAIVAQCSI